MQNKGIYPYNQNGCMYEQAKSLASEESGTNTCQIIETVVICMRTTTYHCYKVELLYSNRAYETLTVAEQH